MRLAAERRAALVRAAAGLATLVVLAAAVWWALTSPVFASLLLISARDVSVKFRSCTRIRRSRLTRAWSWRGENGMQSNLVGAQLRR